jgi:replication-associated recombination protein RarA
MTQELTGSVEAEVPTRDAEAPKRPRSGGGFKPIKTMRGYDMFEVASSLQKAIRRSEVDEACYWASELDLSGYSEYLWKRLTVICSEDIGTAWREGPAVIEALYQGWKRLRAKKDRNRPEGLLCAHATVLLATADKSRYANSAALVHWVAKDEGQVRDVPDHALDRHTRRGKSMGRDLAHFFEVGAKLVNPDGSEPPETEFDQRAIAHFIGPDGREIKR